MSVRQPFHLTPARPGHPIDDASVWSGADYPDDRSWVHGLEPAMAEEIVAAMRSARARGIEARHVTPGDFPLPRTAPLLAEVYREVERGPGFAMIAGFPLEGLDEDEVALAYCGLGAHLGTITVQNREGEYLLEVTDKGKAFDRQTRGYHSTAFLDFHTDGTSIVTLLCLETAAEGGDSVLVGAAAVYNAILRERPDLLPELHRGFPHHRRNQRIEGQGVCTEYRTPVFGFFNDLLHIAYTDSSVRFCEPEGVVLTAREKEALDFMKEVLAREELHVKMSLRKGDLQLVNNFLVLHSRTAYRDAPDRRRKLLRLWLDDENSARLGPGKMDWYLEEHSRFARNGGLRRLPR